MVAGWEPLPLTYAGAVDILGSGDSTTFSSGAVATPQDLESRPSLHPYNPFGPPSIGGNTTLMACESAIVQQQSPAIGRPEPKFRQFSLEIPTAASRKRCHSQTAEAQEEEPGATWQWPYDGFGAAAEVDPCGGRPPPAGRQFRRSRSLGSMGGFRGAGARPHGHFYGVARGGSIASGVLAEVLRRSSSDANTGDLTASSEQDLFRA